MGVHNRNKQYGFASVKPRDAEVVGGKINKKKLFIGIGIILLVILAIWGVNSFFKSDLDTKIKGGVVELFKKDDVANISDSEPEIVIETNKLNNNTASVSGALNWTPNQTVKIALLASPDLFDYKNEPRLDCDALVFVTKEVKRTPKILNETLKVLFSDQFDYGFPPANFIATQTELNFESAVIENGVAKVFLTGKTTISKDECDSKRIGNQIRETAKQFPTVKTVEIYLNGDKTEL